MAKSETVKAYEKMEMMADGLANMSQNKRAEQFSGLLTPKSMMPKMGKDIENNPSYQAAQVFMTLRKKRMEVKNGRA